ncbi:MAG: dynamin family protein [Candidatus Sericytochromatia bacterium]
MSEILKLVFEAKEKVNNLLGKIQELININHEIFSSGPLSESLDRLKILHKKTEEKLTYPEFTISTLGTTSSGKSTFVNGLLGLMLAPMDADELSAGTLKINQNSELKEKCNLIINNEEKQVSYQETYNTICNIMDSYNKNKYKKDSPVPQISIEANFHISNNPYLLGLDNNSKIQIIDLPGLRNISDAENFKIITENVRTSFIIVLINYENLFNKETVDKLYDELKIIKNSVGSTATMLFVLNKVDRRNQTDKTIQETIEDAKKRIKEKLELDKSPDIIPFNSYLFFHIQKAKFAYENAILLNNNSIEFTEEQLKNDIFNVIKNSINIIFKDQANAISSIKKNNKNLIRDIEDLIEEEKIPSFDLFNDFYDLCFNECGADKLFKSIIERTENSLRELILYPAMYKLIDETNNFLNLLDNSITVGKINTQNEIENSKENLKKLSDVLSKEIKNEKILFENKTNNAIKKILGKNEDGNNIKGKKFKEALKDLGLGDKFADIIKEVMYNVEDDVIKPLSFAFQEKIEFHDLSLDLINKYRWKVDNVIDLKSPFHQVQLNLFSNKNDINKGKIFEFLNDSKSDYLIIQEINNHLDLLTECLSNSMNEHLKLELQKRINDFINEINISVINHKKNISDKLENILKEMNIHVKLPDINSKNLNTVEYKGDFIDKIKTESLRNEKINERKVQIGTKEIQEAYSEIESYTDYEVYYERVWYYLWIGKEKREKPVTRQKTVTKYRPIEVPVLENKEFKKVSFYSVRDMEYTWSDGLYELELDLWEDIGTYMINILSFSLSSYEDSISKVMEQIKLILEKREDDIRNQEESEKLLWSDIDIIYKESKEQYKKIKDLIITQRDN